MTGRYSTANSWDSRIHKVRILLPETGPREIVKQVVNMIMERLLRLSTIGIGKTHVPPSLRIYFASSPWSENLSAVRNASYLLSLIPTETMSSNLFVWFDDWPTDFSSLTSALDKIFLSNNSMNRLCWQSSMDRRTSLCFSSLCLNTEIKIKNTLMHITTGQFI